MTTTELTTIKVPPALRDRLRAVDPSRPLAENLKQLLDEHETLRYQQRAAFAEQLHTARSTPGVAETAERRAAAAVQLLRRKAAAG